MEKQNKGTASEENEPIKFFRHVVPFYFSEDYDKVISDLKPYIDLDTADKVAQKGNTQKNGNRRDDPGEYIFIRKPLTKGDSDLFEHIRESLYAPDVEKKLVESALIDYKNKTKKELGESALNNTENKTELVDNILKIFGASDDRSKRTSIEDVLETYASDSRRKKIERILAVFGAKNVLGTTFALINANLNDETRYSKSLTSFYKKTEKLGRYIGVTLDNFRLIIFRTGIGFLTYDLDISSTNIEELEKEYSNLQEIKYELKKIAQKYKKDKNGLCVSLTNIPETTPDLEIIPPELKIADLQKIQYVLKELGYSEKVIGLKEKNNGKEKCFSSLGSWIKHLLSSTVCEDVGFFPERNRKKGGKKPDKALLYTYILNPKPNNDNNLSENEKHTDCPEPQNNNLSENKIHKDCVRLVLGMKNSYDIIDNVPKISSYNNVFWYASYEASGVVAYHDDSNKTFLRTGFLEDIQFDYFVIYILTLYQHYSTIKLFSELSKELSADSADYSNPKENQNEILSQKLEKFEKKINVFLLKSSFSSVSYISNQNKYYNFCKEQLRIEENIKSLSDGLTPLAKMQRIYKDQLEKDQREESEKKEQERVKAEKKRANEEAERVKKQEAEQKNQERRMNILSIVFALFGVASILNDGVGFLGTVNRVKEKNVWVSQMIPGKWIVLVLAVLLAVAALVWLKNPTWLQKFRSKIQAKRNARRSQSGQNVQSQAASGENNQSSSEENEREEQTQ